jgi:iron(III) transport system permease protein
MSWVIVCALASLDAFGAVLRDPEFWASLGRTVVIAVLSSTIAVGVAMVCAYSVARSRRGIGAKAVDLLASSSLAIPATIAGFSCFLLFLSINKWIPLYGTIWALVFAYSYRIAVAYRTSYSTVLQISTELEEAAAASGASRLTTFRRVVLPLLIPTGMAVWIQLVILGANEFTIAAFLATPESRPLSWYLYARINPQAAQLYAPAQGAAMAVIFTLVVLLAGYGLRVLANRSSLARAGRAYRIRREPDPVAPLVGATR